MVSLFGFQITKSKKEVKLDAISPKEDEDAATVVAAGGTYGTYIDMSNSTTGEADLIQKYREISRMPEIDLAIEEIVNEFVDIEDEEIVSIKYSPDVDDKLQKVITAEFEESLRLLDFKNSCYDIVKQWYIDGRLKYQAVIDPTKQIEGIQEVRYVDPRKLRKIKEIDTKADPKSPAPKVVSEYYMYNDKGFTTKANAPQNYITDTSVIGIKISKDSIIDVPSGITDPNKTMVLSYLDKAIKPLNQLRTLEDASIIYTLARAPERRVWYIHTGNLPVHKAKQHFNEMIELHKNKLVYDSTTGNIKDDRKYMTMLEDYWLPRNDEGKGTEVTTLPGGANMGEMGQIEYFEKKLYKALNVPVGRLKESDVFALGRSTQITRDEVKFSKFIARLRLKFSTLFLQIMEKNLLLKQKMNIDDWSYIKAEISIKWSSANYFEELKEAEVLKDRIETVGIISPYIGVFYSEEYVKKQVLNMTDEQIEEMQQQIAKENADKLAQQANNINTMNKSIDPVEDDEQSSDKSESKEDRIQQAKTQYDKLKPKKNRSDQEQSTFRSAAQILGRNKR